MSDPTILQALEEFETCGLPKVSREDTRVEYRRMVEHADLFFAGYGLSLFTAEKKHVRYFVRHLSAADGPAARLCEQCAHCQSAGRKTGGYSATYVKRHLVALRGFYGYALDEGIVASDPTRGVERPKVQPRRQYVPSREEIHALMDYQGTPRSRLLVRLAYYAPARRSEFATLRWGDIDEFAVWRFQEKYDKQHGLKLHAEVLRALRQYRTFQQRQAQRNPAMARALADPETAYVFLTRTGRAIKPGHLARILKRHAVHAGVAVIPAAGKQWEAVDGMTSRLSPHALRRAWASHALNDGEVPLHVVSTVLNHADITTTRRHYAFTDDKRAWDALTRRRL